MKQPLKYNLNLRISKNLRDLMSKAELDARLQRDALEKAALKILAKMKINLK